MPRKTFDLVVSSAGVLIAAVLLVAGGLLVWAYTFADNNVSTQLSAQNITFPEAGSEGITSLPPEDGAIIEQYAGEQLTTGGQAEAYANHFIGVHLQGIADGQTYSEVSGQVVAAGDDVDPALVAQRDTLFRGETLRGLLLTTYGFWTFGQIAFWAAIGAFAAGGIMLVLALLGFWHAARVEPTEKIFTVPSEVPKEAVST